MRRRRVRHDRALLAVVTLLGVVCLGFVWSRPGVADPAPGSGEGFVLSTDRLHWHPSLTEPLFDPARQWAPGDSGSRVVYVRNDDTRAQRVHVSVVLYGRDRADASWAVVSIRPEARDLPHPGPPLQPGGVRRVELRATVDALAADAAMHRELKVEVEVRPDATQGVRAGDGGASSPADARSRLAAASVGGLWAFLALGVARRRRVEQLA